MNEELQLTRLTIEDLDNVVELQKKIIENLPEGQKHFTVHRSKEVFEKALTSKNQFMYGIYVGKSLVAQSMLEFPEIDKNRDMPEIAQGYENSEIAVYKAVLVDPKYRGLGLMRRMLQAREDMAIMCGKKTAICKISLDNKFSWENAMKHGMQIVGVVNEKDKNGADHVKMYLQKSLVSKGKTLTNFKNKMPMIFGNGRKIAAQFMAMFDMGKMGVWDKEDKAMCWVDNPEFNNDNSHDKEQFSYAKYIVGGRV